MLVVFNKSDNNVIGMFSDDQNIEDIYQNNQDALNRLDGIYINDELIPSDNIRDYKLVDGVFVKLIPEELPIPTTSPTMTKINKLKDENETLKAQLAQTNTDLQGFLDYYFANGGV